MSQNLKKRVLVAAIHYPIASGRYIARALRRLGHDVRTVGPATGRSVWGMELPEGTEWVPDYEWSGYLELREWTPDLIITADSAFSVQGPKGTPHVVYGVDNHVRDYRHAEFDHLFLAHSNGHRIGEPNVTHLPCAYDPEMHVKLTDWDRRPQHAAMIGVMYEDRARIVNGMGEAGLRVLAGTGAILDAYTHYYNQALISVCKSIKDDLAQRVFETAAMGCLILSDTVPDMARLGLEEGVHYVGYNTPDEAVERALEIVHEWEPARVPAMIDASRAWVKPHTWDARVQTILDMVFGEGTSDEA